MYALRFAMHTLHIYSNRIKNEVLLMAFRLRDDRKETENKTIRFPLPLIVNF